MLYFTQKFKILHRILRDSLLTSVKNIVGVLVGITSYYRFIQEDLSASYILFLHGHGIPPFFFLDLLHLSKVLCFFFFPQSPLIFLIEFIPR
jgi:hypothetical protein